MATFRIETVYDEATDLFALEIFMPGDPSSLLLATPPTYASKEAGFEDAVKRFRAAFPNKPITAAPGSISN